VTAADGASASPSPAPSDDGGLCEVCHVNDCPLLVSHMPQRSAQAMGGDDFRRRQPYMHYVQASMSRGLAAVRSVV
jgi:hypothetical protein